MTATDPLVAVVTDFAASIEARAQSGGTALLAVVAGFAVLAALLSLWQSRRRPALAGSDGEPGSDVGPGDDLGAGEGVLRHRASSAGEAAVDDVEPSVGPDRDRAPVRPRLALVSVLVPLALVGGLVGLAATAGSDVDISSCVGSDEQEDLRGTDVRPATEEELALLRTECRATALSTFGGMDALQSTFDAHAGTTRVVLLLSPTCITCLRGAAWMQGELAAHPDADVRVYAIWMPVLASDGRGEWDGRILADPRVTHLWDEDVESGTWFADAGFGHTLLWDAYLVYGPEARWEAGGEPTEPLAWNWPIIAHTSVLKLTLQPLMEQP